MFQSHFSISVSSARSQIRRKLEVKRLFVKLAIFLDGEGQESNLRSSYFEYGGLGKGAQPILRGPSLVSSMHNLIVNVKPILFFPRK